MLKPFFKILDENKKLIGAGLLTAIAAANDLISATMPGIGVNNPAIQAV